MLTSSFWRERRVFVTGHTGFKGAWLALMLERLNARTTGYARDPVVTPSLYALADAGREICDVRGDICDADFLDGALRAADPDIVIHLATRPPRGADAGRPDAARRARAEGDRAVAEAVEAAPFVQTALIVSPETRATPRGRKRAANADETRVLTVYCPDPRGGGDFAEAAAAAPSRLHVLDALYGLLLLAEKSCERTAPAGSNWAFAEPEDAAALGWSPLLAPAEAEHWTREWNAAYEAGADMRAATLQQVESYLGQRVRLTSPFAELSDESDGDFRAVVGL